MKENKNEFQEFLESCLLIFLPTFLLIWFHKWQFIYCFVFVGCAAEGFSLLLSNIIEIGDGDLKNFVLTCIGATLLLGSFLIAKYLIRWN